MLAYLDANSGSLIASVIAGGLAGFVVVAKMGWRRVLGAFSPKQRRANKQEREQLEGLDHALLSEESEPASVAADSAEKS